MSKPPIVTSTEVNIRRAPKYLQFALTGFSLGIAAALFGGLGFPEIAGLLVVGGGLVGGVIGIVLALLFDAIFRSRGKKVMATKVTE